MTNGNFDSLLSVFSSSKLADASDPGIWAIYIESAGLDRE
jgi:hypothetical protein